MGERRPRPNWVAGVSVSAAVDVCVLSTLSAAGSAVSLHKCPGLGEIWPAYGDEWWCLPNVKSRVYI